MNSSLLLPERDDWWNTLPATAACHHPYEDRFFPCAQIQKCGWCKSIRLASDADTGKLWPSVTLPSRDVSRP